MELSSSLPLAEGIRVAKGIVFGATECALRICASGQELRSSIRCIEAKGGADVVGRRECEVGWRGLPRISSTRGASGASEGFVTCNWVVTVVGPASIWICAVLYESHLSGVSNEGHYGSEGRAYTAHFKPSQWYLTVVFALQSLQ
jgi:hypothetical protein